MHDAASRVSSGALPLPLGAAADERELVAAIAAGDPEALGALYDRYGATVYSLATSLTGSEPRATEVAREVFGALWREAARLDTANTSVLGWLVAATRARAQALGGRATARGELPAPDAATPERAATSLVTESLARRIRAAAGVLSPSEQQLLTMASVRGLSTHEIARATGRSVADVLKDLSAALAKMRSALTSPDGGDVARPAGAMV